MPSVSSRVVKSAGVPVAYVRLADFSDGAGDELSHVVKQRLKGGAKAVVLDLRGNGGGLLNEAVKAASVFIPEGPVVSTDGRTRPAARVQGHRRRHLDQGAGGGAGGRGHGLGGRDRGRRARGPPPGQARGHAHLRQGRVPGDRAARKRRRARHHGGRVLHPVGQEPRRRRDQARRRTHPERGRAPAAAQPRGQDARDGRSGSSPTRSTTASDAAPARGGDVPRRRARAPRTRRSRRRRSSSAGAPSRWTATSARTPATSSWCGPPAAAAARSCAGSAAPTSRAT